MNDLVTLVPAFVTGIFLGVIFFGGLWWTVQKGVSSNRPVFWFFGSLLLRMSIVLAGFYLVAHGHWKRMLVCLLGFFMARLIMMWLTRAAEKPSCETQETNHAS